jgi:hypothetical protein
MASKKKRAAKKSKAKRGKPAAKRGAKKARKLRVAPMGGISQPPQ